MRGFVPLKKLDASVLILRRQVVQQPRDGRVLLLGRQVLVDEAQRPQYLVVPVGRAGGGVRICRRGVRPGRRIAGVEPPTIRIRPAAVPGVILLGL